MTDAQYKTLILGEIGDDGTVAAQIDSIWSLYSRYSGLEYPLQYKFALRHAIRYLAGAVARLRISYQEKDRIRQRKELMANLATLYKMVNDELMEIKDQMVSSYGISVDQLEAQSPIESWQGWPDANSRIYSGDPNLRPWKA